MQHGSLVLWTGSPKGGRKHHGSQILGPPGFSLQPPMLPCSGGTLLNARLVSLFLIRQKDPTISETLL